MSEVRLAQASFRKLGGWKKGNASTASSHLISHEARSEAFASTVDLGYEPQVGGPTARSARRSSGVCLHGMLSPPAATLTNGQNI